MTKEKKEINRMIIGYWNEQRIGKVDFVIV